MFGKHPDIEIFQGAGGCRHIESHLDIESCPHQLGSRAHMLRGRRLWGLQRCQNATTPLSVSRGAEHGKGSQPFVMDGALNSVV